MKYLLRLSLCLSLLFFSFYTILEAKEKEEVSGEVPVVVMGGGIGGLTSALYLARSGLTPLVIEGTAPGGLLKQSHSVQNWPGEIEIEGASLVEKVRLQAKENGAQFLSEDIISVDFSKTPLIISTRSAKTGQVRQIRANASIIAMGTEPNFLHIPGETGENGYWGRGVTNCAICDGPLYKDQIVGVVGGGDAAVLEAFYLSNIAKEVYVFVRKNSLKAIEKKRVEALLERPNIKIIYDTEVVSIQGDGEKVTGAVLKSKNKKCYEMPLDGLFLAIGSKPNSSIFKDVLKLDKSGYIVLQKDQQTSKEGVYAVGDIVDPVYKQAISASGDGAKAALQAQQFLEDKVDFSKQNKKKQIVYNETSSIKSAFIEISSIDQFEKELASGDKLVVVDFYAPWCGPCKKIAPMLDALANQMSGKVKVLKINIDQLPSLAKSYHIRSVPTVLVFNSSAQLIDRKAGTEEVSQILKEIETDFDVIAAK